MTVQGVFGRLHFKLEIPLSPWAKLSAKWTPKNYLTYHPTCVLLETRGSPGTGSCGTFVYLFLCRAPRIGSLTWAIFRAQIAGEHKFQITILRAGESYLPFSRPLFWKRALDFSRNMHPIFHKRTDTPCSRPCPEVFWGVTRTANYGPWWFPA